MFLSSKLISALEKDHDVLRESIKVLKNRDANIADISTAFSKFAPALKSHAKSEEDVVYKYMLTKSELRFMGLEGQEEHKTAEQICDELEFDSASVYDEKWRAKAKVLAELVEHHIQDEESDVFPALKKHLTAEVDEQMCHRYEMAFDDNQSALTQKRPPAAASSSYTRW